MISIKPATRIMHIAAITIASAVSLKLSDIALAESGVASVYTTKHGLRTASGKPLVNSALTAAHRTLPFGSRVRVTNKRTGRSVVVTITDRGPFIRGRVIDLTMAGASAIGMGYGLAPVTLRRE